MKEPPIAVKININERTGKRVDSEYQPENAEIPVDPIRKYPIASTKKANEKAFLNPNLSASAPAKIGRK
jgi:hypothetical protein